MLTLGMGKRQVVQKTNQPLIKASVESKTLIGSRKSFLELIKKATQREPFDKKRKTS